MPRQKNNNNSLRFVVSLTRHESIVRKSQEKYLINLLRACRPATLRLFTHGKEAQKKTGFTITYFIHSTSSGGQNCSFLSLSKHVHLVPCIICTFPNIFLSNTINRGCQNVKRNVRAKNHSKTARKKRNLSVTSSF